MAVFFSGASPPSLAFSSALAEDISLCRRTRNGSGSEAEERETEKG